MKIFVNRKPVETQASSLADLLREHALPSSGVAMAIDNQIVPRTQWASTPLHEGEEVTLIQAACGG